MYVGQVSTAHQSQCQPLKTEGIIGLRTVRSLIVCFLRPMVTFPEMIIISRNSSRNSSSSFLKLSLLYLKYNQYFTALIPD